MTHGSTAAARGAHSVIEAVGTPDSIMPAIRFTRPGRARPFRRGRHDVELAGKELFFSYVHLADGPAPKPPMSQPLNDGLTVLLDRRCVLDARATAALSLNQTGCRGRTAYV
jgi:hypothetical protein